MDAESGTCDLAVTNQARHDAVDFIDGDRKADAGRRARRAVDGGVDADQAAGGIQQRATGITGVDRGIGLDHAADGALVDGLDFTVERADDAHRQRLIKTEGIADGVDALADHQIAAAADGDGPEFFARCVDTQHGEIAVGKRTDEFGVPFALVGERDARHARPLYDVKVGHDESAFIPHKAAAGAFGHLKDVE